MKKLGFTYILILSIIPLTFAQKKIEKVLNEKYTFSLKNAGEYSGVLLENNEDYYLFENFSNNNKRTRLFKRDVRKVSLFIDKAVRQKSENTFDKDSVKVYFGLGIGGTLGIPRLGVLANIGFRFKPKNSLEATLFGYPGILQSNTGIGLNYLYHTHNAGVTVGLGFMEYQDLSAEFDIIDIGFFKILTILPKNEITKSLYYKIGFSLNNKSRTWFAGIDLIGFKLSEKSRGGILTLTVQKRFYF